MEEKLLLAALAGLVHDAGKLPQRAGERGTREWDQEGAKDFGYMHALLTSDFLERFLPKPWKTGVKNAAASHHRPMDALSQAVAVADHLSANERSDPPDDSNKASQPKQLLSTFSFVTVDGSSPPGKYYLPLAPLAMKESILFPQPAWDKARVDQAYTSLLDDLQAGFGALQITYDGGGDLSTYLESVLLLLQRYTWCVPSAYYRTEPDVSLYDHSRMTAALTAVLVKEGLSIEELKQIDQDKDSKRPVAALIAGDISGIQDYIYTITNRGAASALRGRSFYVQLLTEVLARFCLDALGLPITNLIYAGGGAFYLLGSPGDLEKLPALRRQISRVLFGSHRGDLYAVLAGIVLRRCDFSSEALSHRWEEAGQRIQQAKLNRFAELEDELAVVFEPQGQGGGAEEECQVCGLEHPDIQMDAKQGSEPVRKCLPCRELEKLSDDLRQADYLALRRIQPEAPPSLHELAAPASWQNTLQAFGYQAALLRAEALESEKPAKPSTLWALSDEALKRLPRSLDNQTAAGRKFLVNVTPILTEKDLKRLREQGVEDLPVAGSIKPFHALAAESQGIRRLGVLRMDVDNLGKLFSEGLRGKASLSRIATLSFNISLFFEGWVEKMALDFNQRQSSDRLYSIYSGGDDLFFVGAWDTLLQLAQQVQRDLSAYTGGHEGVHTSAGMVLIGGKYPLAKAAQDAHDALEKAKHHRWLENGKLRCKNSLTFLGFTLPWQKFGLEETPAAGFNAVQQAAQLLWELPAETRNPVVRRLINLHQMYQEEKERRQRIGADQTRSGTPQILWGRWNWMAQYTLFRLASRSHADKVNELRGKLEDDQFRSIEWIGLAARWVELASRNSD